MTPSELTCEYTPNPLGLECARPRFSWILRSAKRAQTQSAYQILVASSSEKLSQDTGDKWDSGQVRSNRTVNVCYVGRELSSAEKCWWKVRVWNADGQMSEWSAPATLEMGLLQEQDWQGTWIASGQEASSPLFRREFVLDGPVRRARVYVCGLGWHELYVNGNKVGDQLMAPAPTWYDNALVPETHTRVLYVTYDVTDLVRQGTGAVGVMLGHGWYSAEDGHPSGRKPFAARPMLLLQMNVELTDGRMVSVWSDETWKTSPGPITANDMAAGEHYDARMEQPGWDTAGFEDSKWVPAKLAKAPGGKLVSQMVEPVRVTDRLKPTRVLKSGDNSCIFDMGRYISGCTELRVRGTAGTRVTLEHAGRVNYDTGDLDRRNNLSYMPAQQLDSYTLKSNGLETWKPRFTVHGFRYVKVTGYPGEPTPDDVTGCATNSDVEISGEFACSNDLLNQIHRNISGTFCGSFQGIPQDAADRAERLGWLGDTGFVAEDYMFNFKDVRFWSKWLDDISDSQKRDGQVAYVCPPNWGQDGYSNWPCWESTYSLIAWLLYQYYDDVQVLERHYEGMRRQVEYFRARARNHILEEPLGDHMEPRDDGSSSFTPTRTPAALTGTAYYHKCVWILAQAAALLGRKDDAEGYSRLAKEIKVAFNHEYFFPETNQYATGSQTCNALALCMDLVPPDCEEAVLKNLVADIDARGGHLSTGIIGTAALADALPRYGRADVMYRIATQTTHPSWGYGVVNGQTSLSEDFDGSAYRSVSMKMFGSIERFFYKNVAGISPASPGWQSITVEPAVVGDLKWARASVDSIRGPVAVEWRKGDGDLTLNVTVPVNATASVRVPTCGLSDPIVTEGGRPVWRAGRFIEGVEGVARGVRAGNRIVFEVGCGSYVFKMNDSGR